MKITSAQARRLTLNYQLNRFADSGGKLGVLDVINKLSYVQIDTISVVERAHHHILYNRVKDYRPEHLNDLLAKDKTIWEYWAHAAAYVPIEDYPYYKIRMHNFPNGSWEKRFWELHKDLAKPILNRIRKEGPLSTRHFENTRKTKSSEPWGNLKPAKIMLELLMWKGNLIVTARDNFQRVYDLTERVIPDHKKIELPSDQKRAEFMIRRTLQAHGLATENDINNHIKLAERKIVNTTLKHLLHKGMILSAKIDNVKDDFYVLADTDLALMPVNPFPDKLYILSPFDNAVILRKRLLQIFNFEYALECYVTPVKRIFGYWNCPLLWRDELVGMLDPKADRKSKNLIINSIFIDKKIWKLKSFQKAFEHEVSSFAAFNGCKTFTVNNINLT